MQILQEILSLLVQRLMVLPTESSPRRKRRSNSSSTKRTLALFLIAIVVAVQNVVLDTSSSVLRTFFVFQQESREDYGHTSTTTNHNEDDFTTFQRQKSNQKHHQRQPQQQQGRKDNIESGASSSSSLGKNEDEEEGFDFHNHQQYTLSSATSSSSIKTPKLQEANNKDLHDTNRTTSLSKTGTIFFDFDFDAVFGDNMVLQHGTQAAVYGFLSDDCIGGVEIYLFRHHDDDTTLVYHTNQSNIRISNNDGGGGGETTNLPPRTRWKTLLPPQPPGGNYSIRATCLVKTTATTPDLPSPLHSASTRSSNSVISSSSSNSIELVNITYGDVWFCSGQSNMGLPLKLTFEHNDTLKDILRNNKYSNIRIMAGYAKNPPYDNHNDDAGAGRRRHKKQLKKNHHPNYEGYGKSTGSNPWMTAQQAAGSSSTTSHHSKLMEFGATCWYFGQTLIDLGVSDIPIGLINTAVGESRISYFMDAAANKKCQGTNHEDNDEKDGKLFQSHILPFVDFTIKGWIWYQGEHDMNSIKGSSIANIGYGCKIQSLIESWRSIWSQIPNTTSSVAPFGIVTLTSSAIVMGGGGQAATVMKNLGMMRHSQTANYGVLPNPKLPNTFLAQAYDLDDEWGAFQSKCLQCNLCGDVAMPPTKTRRRQQQQLISSSNTARRGRGRRGRERRMKPTTITDNDINSTSKTSTCHLHRDVSGGGGGSSGNIDDLKEACRLGVCAVAMGTNVMKSELHPRNKKPVGERLAIAAYNTVYGGRDAYTGPTLQGCSIIPSFSLSVEQRRTTTTDDDDGNTNNKTTSILEVRFNSTLLRGDKLSVIPYPPLTTKLPPNHDKRGSGNSNPPPKMVGGSQLWVQVSRVSQQQRSSAFCMEPLLAATNKKKTANDAGTTHSNTSNQYYCPSWAGGNDHGLNIEQSGVLDDGWINVDFSLAPVPHDDTKFPSSNHQHANAIHVDLSTLPKGAIPTAIKYAWGYVDCCYDERDPNLYVDHGCIANCPIRSLKHQLPANPFMAKINIDGGCECVPPQECND